MVDGVVDGAVVVGVVDGVEWSEKLKKMTCFRHAHNLKVKGKFYFLSFSDKIFWHYIGNGKVKMLVRVNQEPTSERVVNSSKAYH